jgi:signal peptidase I
LAAAACAGALVRPAYLAFGLIGVWLCLLLPLGVYVATAVDAAMRAPSRPRRVGIWIVLVAMIGFSIARAPIGLMLRALFLEAFKIPSGGVLPTLAVGDHIFVDKLSPKMRLARRGELIVFPSPERPEYDYVQRVIALPGESVRLDGARLFINGWQVPRCDVGRWSYVDGDSGRHEGTVVMEFLGDGAYLVFDDNAGPAQKDSSLEWRVAEGQFFVLGDNRNNSYDSRMWYGGRGGGVPERTVRGFSLAVWLSRKGEREVAWDRVGADLTGRIPLPPPGLENGVARCLATKPSGPVGPPP